jgi:Ca-activated chloride channel family protein
MPRIAICTVLLLLLTAAAYSQAPTQGELGALDKTGKPLGMCPLKHTNVRAEVSGFMSRVRVTQEFQNNFADKIEAVYAFPLPHGSSVDDFTMRIGDRVVRGKMMKREEARETYEAARTLGRVASLLDQERPNIFTQSVANILPGEKITIEISYVETLRYEDGAYEFVFPMVVAPRYIPGTPVGRQGGGFAPDTDKVRDASKITPRIARDRTGHDIAIEVKIDAGVAIESVVSKSHEIDSAMLSASSYHVKLRGETTIPNKDFVLRFDVAGKKIADALLTHRGDRGGFFMLMLQPPDTYRPQDLTPKEIVFVLDTSGSMSGFPIEKAKEAMKLAIDGLHPQDTFNLITFSGDTAILFPEPVPATEENLEQARAFLASRRGSGGTEMMKAVTAALDPSDSKKHVRIVCFMTDGHVGNDNAIIAEIEKHKNARVFAFGIGNSVNRFLLDKMAKEGRGEVEYVLLGDDGSAAARRFHERIRSPMLTDLRVDFGALEVADVYPTRIGDLFSSRPVIIHGRYTAPGTGVIRLIGRSAGNEVVREIPVDFPEKDPRHDVLATMWARNRIDDLTSRDYTNTNPEITQLITNIGLEHRLMTRFTSFVAVEERVVTDGGQPRRIEVPVELPDGMSRQGVAGGEQERPTGSLALSGMSANYSRQVVSVGAMVPSPTPLPQSGRRAKRVEEVTNSMANVEALTLYKTTANGRKVLLTPTTAQLRTAIRALSPVKPTYPDTSTAVGDVKVELTLDPNGRVVNVKTLEGERSLRAAAESAAMATSFEIPRMDIEVHKVTGVMVYSFANDRTVRVTETLQRVEIEVKTNKYHPAILAVVVRAKTGAQPAEDVSNFVADGRAEIVVRLRSLTPAAIEELTKLGFEFITEVTSANAVVGRIRVEDIALIAELEQVTFISPQYR